MEQEKIQVLSSTLSFEIKRMEDIHDNPHQAQEEAHRHDYYTVLLIEEAKGIHRIDFDDFDMHKHQVFFVAPGQVHHVNEKEKSFGFVMLFSQEFLVNNHINENFIKDINLFRDYGYSPPLELSEELFNDLKNIAIQIEVLSKQDFDMKYDAIGAYLKLFLIKCHNKCDLNEKDHPQNQQAGFTILREFKNLVESNYRLEHKVTFYSEKLFVSSDHLNKTVKTLTGVSAKVYIQNRIVMEAKRLLINTSLSSKEIGYELGFKDPAHFSAFFKNCTNESVSEFRKN